MHSLAPATSASWSWVHVRAADLLPHWLGIDRPPSLFNATVLAIYSSLSMIWVEFCKSGESRRG